MSFKKFLIFYFLLAVSCEVTGQTVFDWLNTAPDGNFRQGLAGNRWFDNVLLTNIQDEPGGSGIILRFNNNNQLATTNNVTGTYSIYQLLFGTSNTTARTISGNSIRLTNYLGVNPRIENQSTATHLINANLEGDGNPLYPLELNPVSGNLTIGGAINNQGSPLHILGASSRIINLNGIVSGGGDFELRQNALYFPNASNTYTGTTTITSGIAYASSNVIASTNGAFGNHPSGLFLNGGEIKSNTATFSRPITITGNNSFVDAYGSARTISSSITLLSGTVNLNVGGFFAANLSGQDLTLSGPISNTSGSLSLTKISTSSVTLSGNNSFSGNVTVQMGTLTIGNASSLPPTAGVILSGGTFRIGSVAAASTLNAASLSMTSSSVLDMGTATNPYNLVFANSGPTFTGTLTINNWSAANGKRIRITNTTHIATVLGQINFTGYGTGAQIVNGDELWPAGLFITQNSGSGNFSDAGSWLGGVVPPANSNIFVQSGFTLSIDGSYNLRSIDVSGTLSCTANHTLTLGNVLSKISNGGTIILSNGNVVFASSGGYIDGVNAFTFNNITTGGPLTFLRAPTINGTFQLNSGASVNGAGPVYASNSTLIFNTGGTHNRNVEWNSSSGGGFPFHVIISNNTNVNANIFPITGALATAGDLTIDAGSVLNMSSITIQLRIARDVNIGGGLVLSATGLPGADMFVARNWNRYGSTPITENNRTVIFNGPLNSTITGPTFEYFRHLTIDKNNTIPRVTVTLNSPITVNDRFTLTNGVIVSSATNLLTIGFFGFNNGGSGSASSYVSGPMRKIIGIATSYTFPTGRMVGSGASQENHYRPITISGATSGSSHEYTAEFFRADPINQGQISAAAKAAGLQRISRCEYWDLTKSSSATNVTVTLTWSSNPAGASRCNVGAYVMNLSGIVAVQYNGTEWGDTFGGTPSGTNANGQVAWSGASLFNKFVLGSNTTELNPLAFNLVKFEGRSRSNDVELNFTVNGNTDQKEYLVERSNDGIHFTNVEIIQSDVNLQLASYISYDRKPFTGLNYYRLTAYDLQGKAKQSQTIQLWYGKRPVNPFVFPNPVTGNQIHLYTSGFVKGNYQVMLMGTDGRLVYNKTHFIDPGQSFISISVPAGLSEGVYWLKVSNQTAQSFQFKVFY